MRAIKITTMVTRTWLTAGPPTVVQASSRATKGKRRNRCRSRSIRVRRSSRGSPADHPKGFVSQT